MSIFDCIRLVLKLRHRPFRIFSNFEKIFTELGDTAHQSWKISENSGNSPGPRQLFMKITEKVFISKDLCIISDPIFSEASLFVTRDIGAEYELGLRIWSAWPYVQNSWPKKLFFENFGFFNTFSYVFDIWLPQKIHTFWCHLVRYPSLGWFWWISQ